MSNPFSVAERALWSPPEKIDAAEWGEKYRVLGPRVSAVPGPYRCDRTPYVREPLRTLSDREHREVVVAKCVQSGGSELGRTWLGSVIDLSPAPIMIVYPNAQSAQENLTERVRPMFEDSPRLATQLTGRPWDVKTKQIDLRACSIYLAWSGSATALSSRPICYLILDEVDKYAGYRGVEADAASLAEDRTLTYGQRRKVLKISTPTVPTGPIWTAFRAAGDRRHFHVSCDCGHWMKPEWEQVRWDGREAESKEAMERALVGLESGEIKARFVCKECNADYTQREWHQRVRRGAWISEGCDLNEHPPSESVGFHIHGLVSPWIGVQRLAQEFVSASLRGLPELQNFHNAFLGVPFWDDSVHGDAALEVTQHVIWQAAAQSPPKGGDLPEWSKVVLAGVDSKGKGGHQYVIRAFGDAYRSRLLEYGETNTSDQMHKILNREWYHPGLGNVSVSRACVDCGGSKGHRKNLSRTDELYRWCQTDPARLWAVKGIGGSNAPLQPVLTRSHMYHPPGEPNNTYDVTLSMVDTLYFKDMLAGLILNGDGWELFPGIDSDYVSQMCSERRILYETKIRIGETNQVWRWVPRVTGKIRNHYWDAETYCLVAAYMLHLGRLPDPPAVEQVETWEIADEDEPLWHIGR